jgi:predicted fused transcriptional regulator/phosphomethylpyrimidine kinase
MANKEAAKILASAALATEVASAVVQALEAGLDKAHVAAVLGRIAELLEEGDD